MWIDKAGARTALSSLVLLFLFAANQAFSDENNYPFGQNDRDPFKPLIDRRGQIMIIQEIDFTGLDLRGIIYSEEEATVVINDEVLKEGQAIGEYTILSIGEKAVLLKKGDERFTLKLEEE